MDSPTDEQIKDMTPEQIAALQKQNCPFCMIVQGKIPAIKVAEEQGVIAVMDIRPAAKGHVILFTKEHHMLMPQMSEKEIGDLAILAKRVSNGILTAMKVQGTTIFAANGQAAGQKAPHFLLHVIPRKEGDGLFKLETMHFSDEELKKLVEALK